jgi:hypothetical protein
MSSRQLRQDEWKRCTEQCNGDPPKVARTGDEGPIQHAQRALRPQVLSNIVAQPPTFSAPLAFLYDAASVHEDLPAPVAHRRKAPLPGRIQLGITEKPRSGMQTGRRFGAELAADHGTKLC